MEMTPSLDEFVDDTMRQLARHIGVGGTVEFDVPITVGVVGEDLGVVVAEMEEVIGKESGYKMATARVSFQVTLGDQYAGVQQ